MTPDPLLPIFFVACVIGIALDLVSARGTSMVIVAVAIFAVIFLKSQYIERLEDFCYTNPDYPKCYKVEEWRNKFREDKTDG